MEIDEMINIQRKCRKRAKSIVKRAYRLYDRIWTDRIRVTSELEATGLVGKINSIMPNLLLRKGDAPDINETASVYGFASGQALAEYLAAYEPRGKHEDAVYKRLVEKAFAHLPLDEYEVAYGMETRELAALLRECKAMARDCTQQAYEKYDEIWAGKIRITPELQKHGKEVIAEINGKMPNLLTHDPGRSALDQVAMLYDFETSQDLVDYLLAYEPRGASQEAICDQLVREALGLHDLPPAQEFAGGVDQVPF